MASQFGGVPVETGSKFGGVPVGAAPQEQPQAEEVVEPSALEIFTGEARATPQTETLPELQDSGLLSGESGMQTALITPALITATDPDEIVKIVTSNFPNVGVAYDKDAQGNIYPILRNNETGAVAQVNKPGVSTFDVIQGLGIGAAYTPAGKAATVLGAAAKAGATELAIQAAQEASGGELNAGEVALSSLTGGLFKGGENLIGAGYRAVKGTPADDVVKAGADAGIPIMTTDIRQPQTFAGKMAQQTGEKIPLAGTGGMRETQQATREQAIADVAEKYGQFSYDSIVDSLVNQKNRVKRAAGNVLNTTGKTLDEVGVIPIDKTKAAITEVSEELNKAGVIRSEGAISDLDVLIKSLDEAPQSFTTLKENITAFRDIAKGADKAERSQLSSRAKALLLKVESAMKSDRDTFAKTNLSAKEYASWKKANTIYADEAQKLTKTRLKSVLDKGDVSPEVVQNLLFSQKPSEVKLLFNSLTPSGKSNAKSAIISKVVNDLNRRATGLTPNSFASEMKKYGLQTGAFFKGEEAKQLNGLLKALDATRRAQDAAITTPTGQQLLGAGTLAAAATDLGATLGLGGTAGGFARLYESAPVRNALLRLDSIPKGSTGFERALREAVDAITVAAQTARSELQE